MGIRNLIVIIFALLTLNLIAQDYSHVLVPEGTYTWWPRYQHLSNVDLDTISAQPWLDVDHVIKGWDWSFPNFIEPSPRSSVGLQRKFGTNQAFSGFNLKFKANSTGLLWVKWRDIEPTMDAFNFKPVIDRIKQANSLGTQISLRILCHSKSRGTTDGEAPLWLDNLGVNLLPRENTSHNLNYDPSHPKFHERYLKLISEIAKTEIPQLVKNMYIGYASHSYGDEGIGPYGERNSDQNDTVKHVRERLDAWENAFKGMESKIYMGGSVEYGFQKGFGARRGFVEMYTYNIPNRDMGQYIDDQGYLRVDENGPLIRYKCFHGEVNEEYETRYYTEESGYQFGASPVSFPYRYFMSNLRALQMQCTYVHTTGHLLPRMLPFIAQQLGRTVEDTPDVWSFLNTFYHRVSTYTNFDWKIPKRTFTQLEKNAGIETKNFERWLYQRDAPGYETVPEEKIQHAIKMWMIQPDNFYDYIARSGKKIGFNIDSRWPGINYQIAIKVSYFDRKPGSLNIVYFNGVQMDQKSQILLGDNELKTVTFFLPKLVLNGLPNNFDFALEAGEDTEKIVVSMVRVIQADESISSNPDIISKNNPIRIIHQSAQKNLMIQSGNPLIQIDLFDISGKNLYSINQSENNHTIQTDYKPGVYVLFVRDVMGNVLREKLILN